MVEALALHLIPGAFGGTPDRHVRFPVAVVIARHRHIAITNIGRSPGDNFYFTIRAMLNVPALPEFEWVRYQLWDGIN
jgi:hypothetical protein